MVVQNTIIILLGMREPLVFAALFSFALLLLLSVPLSRSQRLARQLTLIVIPTDPLIWTVTVKLTPNLTLTG